MKQHKNRLYFLTALAVMTNGFSLIGCAHGSVGAVAKNIEANHNISRGIATELTLRGHSGNPPAGRNFPIPGVFDMSSLVCCNDHLA